MNSNGYQRLLFPLLKRMDAERSHRLALRALHFMERVPGGLATLSALAPDSDPRLRVKCFGLDFPNPLGVAAGLDKDAEAIAALFALGFGSVETGTVTPHPQPGNPHPRMWRFPNERAVINSMGFPSQGSDAVQRRLFDRQFPGVLGINLGKNRQTSLEQAATDYVAVLNTLWPLGGYFTINVSSPNTPGLRALQGRDALAALVGEVQRANRRKAEIYSQPERPVLVKIAPDLDNAALDEVLAGSMDGGAAGLIVSNTTTDRSILREPHEDFPGGVSGSPLRARANELVQDVYRRMGESNRLPIIGVGGISTAADVIERMRSGASLVQIYTGFIYGGPGLPGRILRDLSAYLDRAGIQSVEEIIGEAHKSPSPTIGRGARGEGEQS